MVVPHLAPKLVSGRIGTPAIRFGNLNCSNLLNHSSGVALIWWVPLLPFNSAHLTEGQIINDQSKTSADLESDGDGGPPVRPLYMD